MIVGEALGENEATLGEPFIGMCGKTLKKMLADANIPQESYYITNTVKCWPYEKNENRTKETIQTPPEFEEFKNYAVSHKSTIDLNALRMKRNYEVGLANSGNVKAGDGYRSRAVTAQTAYDSHPQPC